MKRFHDNDHANNRLQRCFVARVINGVFQVEQVHRATLEHLNLENGEVWGLHDNDVHVTYKHLGYVNTKTQCKYLSRSTRRMWKAGVCDDNLVQRYLFQKFATIRDKTNIKSSLEYILNNKYPSFAQAYREVKLGRKAAVAFCPTMCVGLSTETKLPVLYYKNKPFAFIQKKKIVIGDVNSHLLNVLLSHTDMEILC